MSQTPPLSTPRELQATYPYMFSGRNIGLSISRGWFELFARLCHDIDQVLGNDKQNFHWSQLKEKFGAPRWYFDLGKQKSQKRIDLITGNSSLVKFRAKVKDKDVVRKAINDLVDKAEAIASKQCISCGSPGKNDATGGFYLVVCEKHAVARRVGSELLVWFDEPENFA